MNRCFVIGPIGDKFAPLGSAGREHYEDALQVYESVIVPACQAVDLVPVRADGIARAGEITEQIFRHLREDEVVIADVSGGNPNVMYELGLRHTVDKLTLQIGEYGQLPFDVTAVRTIQFSRSDRGLIDARKALLAALEVGLSEGGDPVTATRIWSHTPQALDAIVIADGDAETGNVADEEETDEAGFLDRIGSMEEKFPAMTVVIEDIGQILEQLGLEAQSAGSELQTASSTNVTARTRLVAIQRFASVLQPRADELTSKTSEFSTYMNEIDDDVKGLLRHLDGKRDDIEHARGFLQTLVTLAHSSREGMEGLNQFGGQVRSLGAISKVLRRPGLQMATAIDTMAAATALMDDWSTVAQRLLRWDNGPLMPTQAAFDA